MREIRSLRSVRISGLAAAAALVLSGCVIGATGDPHLATDTSVVLTGTLVSTAYEPADYWFEYGATTGYGSQTSPARVVVTQPSTSVSTSVTGLTPGTLYHYRLCYDAVNDSLPSSCGADRTVSTGVGRVSVTGSFTVIYRVAVNREPVDIYDTTTIDAVADPVSPGYLDGTLADTQEWVRVLEGDVIYQSGPGTELVVCLRVAGNFATVGYGGASMIAIEDRGPGNVDLYADVSRPAGEPCPAPTASALGPNPQVGDFTISGG